MTKCPLCDVAPIERPDEKAMQACSACAEKLAITPIPPPMRRRAPCRACNGTRFLRAIPRDRSETERPMHLTYAPLSLPSYSYWNDERKVSIGDGCGRLEVYACFGCGLVEWYCRDVPSVPAHPHLMTEVIDVGDTPDGPYR